MQPKVPGPLTAETESKKAEKKKAQKAQKKQREKEQKEVRKKQEQEEEEKRKFASLTDREKVSTVCVGLISGKKHHWECKSLAFVNRELWQQRGG